MQKVQSGYASTQALEPQGLMKDKNCKDCNRLLRKYSNSSRCWKCWNKFRRIGAKWLVKYCIDCGVPLKSKVAKRCLFCRGRVTSKLRKGVPLSPSRRKIHSDNMKKLHKNEKFELKRKAAMPKGKAHHNYKHGKSSKPNNCIDCNKLINWRSTRCKICSNRINTKKYWQNPEYRKKALMSMLKSSHVKPNKKETILYNLLKQILPKEYKINVKGQVMILGRKVPDFVNVNGQKKIIEMYGDYWHSNEFIKRKNRCYEDTEKGRIKYFRKLGWQTLIIWEHELKNLKKVEKKILKFNKK